MTSGTSVITDNYKYTTYGELSSYVAKYKESVVYSLDLGYDDLGRIIKKIEVIKGSSQTYDYSYDLRNRLNEVKKNGAVVSKYNYDSNGNRISGIVSGQTVTAMYDSQDRLVSYNSDSFQYNLNGELETKKNNISNQVTPFTYNSFGQLSSVKVGSATYSYEIDGFGRRIQNSTNGKLQNTYIYQDQIRLAGVVSADGKVLQRFIYGSKFHVPDYILMNGERYRIITDHLGSVRLVLRLTDGAVVQSMVHDEFGRIEKSSSLGFQPFGFAGGLTDFNTNLIQFGARWYNPEVGRWISKDPIGFAGGDMNLYGYVGGSSVFKIDPLGLFGLFGSFSLQGSTFGASINGFLSAYLGEDTKGAGIGGAIGGGATNFSIGLSGGKGLSGGFYANTMESFLNADSVDINSPLGGLSFYYDKSGNFEGFAVGGPSLGVSLSFTESQNSISLNKGLSFIKNRSPACQK